MLPRQGLGTLERQPGPGPAVLSTFERKVSTGPAVLSTFERQVGPGPAVLSTFERQVGPGLAVLGTFERQVDSGPAEGGFGRFWGTCRVGSWTGLGQKSFLESFHGSLCCSGRV